MGLFDSLIDLTSNVVKIAVAPLEAAVDVTNAVVKPLADATKEVTDTIKSIKD